MALDAAMRTGIKQNLAMMVEMRRTKGAEVAAVAEVVTEVDQGVVASVVVSVAGSVGVLASEEIAVHSVESAAILEDVAVDVVHQWAAQRVEKAVPKK